MINRKSILMCVLMLLMLAYFGIALTMSARLSKGRALTGMDISLDAPGSRFVTKADILAESGIDPDTISRIRIDEFNLRALEMRLRASDKLQDANATVHANGRLCISVKPMQPVARVFDPAEPSYYINATGKRISAELRYHIDVPVLVGTFDSVYPAKRLLPLLDYIASHPVAGAMVSTVTQEPDGNIIIVPTIVGHVVEFGDTSRVAEKFGMLRDFYRYVAPVKGWEKYDTISVAWRRQVVATRRNKTIAPIPLPTEEEMTGSLDIDGNSPDLLVSFDSEFSRGSLDPDSVAKILNPQKQDKPKKDAGKHKNAGQPKKNGKASKHNPKKRA